MEGDDEQTALPEFRVAGMRMWSVFKPPRPPRSSGVDDGVPVILCLDFHRDGNHMVSVDSHSQLRLSNCAKGTSTKHFDLGVTASSARSSFSGASDTMDESGSDGGNGDESSRAAGAGERHKHGPVGLCRYTHHVNAVLLTSRGSEGDENSNEIGMDCDDRNVAAYHDIRYYSVYDNTYLRFFRGHTDEVTSLSMCPADDHFVSGSRDRTIRMWNLKA
jgi:WD40 repeat protein